MDTRPQEKIQHSWKYYGKFVYKHYGVEAYNDLYKNTHPTEQRPYDDRWMKIYENRR